MPEVGIKIEGLQETIELFQKAPRTVVATGFVKAFSAAGNVIADVLEANTPIKAEDTGGILAKGELRESVAVSVQLDADYRGGAAFVGFTTANGADSVALWLDMGHRIVARNGKELGMFAGTAFMRRSAEQSSERAIATFVAEIEKTVKANFPQESAA